MDGWRSLASRQARHLLAFQSSPAAGLAALRSAPLAAAPPLSLSATQRVRHACCVRFAVGKSTLLTELTGTNSEAAGYEFTT